MNTTVTAKFFLEETGQEKYWKGAGHRWDAAHKGILDPFLSDLERDKCLMMHIPEGPPPKSCKITRIISNHART
jgi:hypothetical protein